jgi:hypothetical protein
MSNACRSLAGTNVERSMFSGAGRDGVDGGVPSQLLGKYDR